MKKGELKDGQSLMRDVSHIGHHGIGDYECHINNDDDIKYIISLIKQSYNR